jgi:hypothetical protein
MLGRVRLVFLYAWLAGAASSCAPQDEHAKLSDPADDERPAELAQPLPVLPSAQKDRIDAVLKHIRSRDLLQDNSFWTIFHGILGMGFEDARLLDTRTGTRTRAIEYVAQGGDIRGMEFTPTGDGVEVVTWPGSGVGQGHQDQFIAEMAQWGMPLDKPFIVKGKHYTFEDFVKNALARARTSGEQELSWTVLIAGQYYGPGHRWTNNAGQKLTVEDLLRFEINQPIADSPVCGGTHRLFGITWVYHLHRQQGGKKEGTWKDAADTIAHYVQVARDLQNPDGSFSTGYLKEKGNARDSQLQIATTGHVFEWLALALTDAQLRESWVQNAANALVLMVLEHSSEPIDGGALYHAAHGLSIYRARMWGPEGNHSPVIPPPPLN